MSGLDLKGIIPPVSTPMTGDGEVAVDDLRNLVSWLIDSGVHGVFMLGSTSEVVGLTDAQQDLVVQTAIETVAGRVPVLAGAIDFTTSRVIDRAKRSAAAGVDALVVLSPFYIKPSATETIRHFTTIREAIDTPIVAYDIPQAVQTKLDRATIRTLAQAGTIAGLKDSSGQEANFRGVIIDNADLPDFRIFTGSELMADIAIAAGAAGCVPGLGNVDPTGFVRLYDAASRGDFATARREQERLYRLFEIVTIPKRTDVGPSAGGWGSFKVALKLRGVIENSWPTYPMTPLDADEEAAVAAILRSVGLR
jgi:4-hydroxy-tetrahydrodipicolinate synthase